MIDFLTHEIGNLFVRLADRYGSEWTMKWAERDPKAMVTAWREELHAFAGGSQSQIAAVFDAAMHNLPPRPVNAPQFRQLCEQAREGMRRDQHQPAGGLPVRGPTPEERAKLQELRNRVAGGNLFARPSTDWAFRLVDRHAAGESVSHAALKMAREVVESVQARRALAEFRADIGDAHPSASEPDPLPALPQE